MTSVTYMINDLERRRRDLDMPLKYLSNRANVSLSTVRRVFTGELGPSIGAVAAIGDALGVHDLRNISKAR